MLEKFEFEKLEFELVKKSNLDLLMMNFLKN